MRLWQWILVAVMVLALGGGARPAAAQPAAEWARVAGVPASVSFQDMALASPALAWAVGFDQPFGSDEQRGVLYALHLRAGRWQAELTASYPAALQDIDLNSPDDMWVVMGAGATLLRKDAAGWRQVPGIAGASSTDYITALDMAGCSITLLKLDDELVRLWDAPVDTPALRWGV